MNAVKKPKQKANAVFEGGGVKGIGIAGALSVASKYYDWLYVAGTSAGAIIAALVAAGYTPAEIRDRLYNFDFRNVEDPDAIGQVPWIGPLLSLEFNLGIYKGDYMENWIREALRQKGIRLFGDLVVPRSGKNPRDRYRLRVVASDISTGDMLVLPQDIARYGIDPDYLDVARAVRMSLSIPYFFQPVKVSYIDDTGKRNVSYIVDGGVLSNFPVWLFDECRGAEKLPTFGFKLVSPDEGRPNRVKGPITMLKALFETMMEAHDNRYIEEENFQRTIAIPTLGIRTTDFHISSEKARELFQAGASAAEKFFKTWDYQHYMTKYAVKLTASKR